MFTKNPEKESAKAEVEKLAAEALKACPEPDKHYKIDVNRGSVNEATTHFTYATYYMKGYRLAEAWQDNGNSVTVWEHRFHA